MMTFFVTFACKCSFLVIIIIILFYRTDAIGITNLQNRITFSHQTQLICGPLSDTCAVRVFGVDPDYRSGSRAKSVIFRLSSLSPETYHRIFKCNTSKRRSGQELPFIFFELRAATCLWGRYDPKTENFTLFHIYLLHINFPFKNILCPCKELP